MSGKTEPPQDIEVGFITKKANESNASNTANNFNGYITLDLKTKDNFIISSTCHIRLSKEKWKKDSIWMVKLILFQDSHIGGFHLFHSPPMISCFEENEKLNFQIELDWQIADASSTLTTLGDHKGDFLFFGKAIKTWLNEPIEKRQDILKIQGKGKEIKSGKFIRLKKSFLLQSDLKGIAIKEVDSYSKNELKYFKEILKNSALELVETKNLPLFLEH